MTAAKVGNWPKLQPATPPQKDMPTSDATAATATTNSDRTSPLTVSSLEAAAAAGTTAACNANDVPTSSGQGNVPQVVSRLVQTQMRPVPDFSVEGTANAMAMLGINDYGASFSSASNAVQDDKSVRTTSTAMRLRTPPTEHDNRKLFVGGLPIDVTEDGFYAFFSQFGPVVDSVVMVDRLTKRSRGFGFVTFANEDDALRLLTAIPGKTGYVFINRKQCEVKASTPKTGDGVTKHQGGSGAGQWRSNQSNHRDNNRGYNRTTSAGSVTGQSKHQQVANREAGDGGVKQTHLVNKPYYSQDIQQVQVLNAYQMQMGAYGRNHPAYYPNYQGESYPSAASSGYVYSAVGSSAVPTAPKMYFAPYPLGHGNTGYYNPYTYNSQYNPQYGSQQYGNQSLMPPSSMTPLTGHPMGWNAASYTNYHTDGIAPSQGVGYGYGYGHNPQQAYRDDNNESGEESASAEEYD